ncbi:single-stranded DNA-binding protein [Nitrobacter sp. TKz-YC02]|uniref:single-stranded DNA-binding protein n=1 Tax=Nitrobacter sp. TKz-YC02 TaxID=3398704 RepID=UPI003CF41AD3
MNFNKVLLLGKLTRDPELKALANGGSIATFTLATNRRVKKGNEKVEQPEFHNIVVFGKQAESCAQFLRKGSIAHVEGRIQTRTYEKDGVKMYRTDIVAENVQFGPRPGAANGPVKDVAPEDDTDQRPPSERGSGEATASAAPIPYPEEEDIDISNIPF